MLLGWLLAPMLLLAAIGTASAYRNAVDYANRAYDRSLLISARAIAERVQVKGGRVSVDVPYAAVDLFESDIGARFYFRVSGYAGEFVAGVSDFPPVPPGVPRSELYPALVRFYDTTYLDEPVRVAALHQPVVAGPSSGVALVQVAETFEARTLLARRMLFDTLLRQGALLGAAALLVVVAVQLGLRPIGRLRESLSGRAETDLTPLDTAQVPRELRPLVATLNGHVARLANLIELRRHFISNAAHQLRTPLAVLKTQIGLAQRETDPAALVQITRAMDDTIDGAVRLAQQLLSLTRAEHGSELGEFRPVDLAALARDVCLDHAVAAHARGIDLGYDGSPGSCPIQGDAVLLRELVVNLLDNALKYCPTGARITVRVQDPDGPVPVVLEVEDDGPGIPPEEYGRVLGRFYRLPGQQVPGSGLGLAIVREIAMRHGASVHLRKSPDSPTGLLVAVRFGAP